MDIDSDTYAGELMEKLAVRNSEIPVVYCNSHYVLRNPSIAELAQCLDLNINTDKSVRDVVVVGAGPAGLAAAVYAASEGLGTLVTEKSAPGGQVGSSSRIENYLGFPREFRDKSSPTDPSRRPRNSGRRSWLLSRSPHRHASPSI